MDGTTSVIDEDMIIHHTPVAVFTATKSRGEDQDFGRQIVPREAVDHSGGLRVTLVDGKPALPVLDSGRRASLVVKRAIDIVGAVTGLLLLCPLLVIVAICVRMTDRGPVFFRQARVGLDGRHFEIFKFRSMYWNRCDISGVAQTVANDDRVTPIGAFIRKTSIDELPQLINVLIGDMSLVGPRPHVRGMMAAGMTYENLVEHYDFRHTMRPGLTGWAQCNGLRGPTIERSKAVRRVEHDFAYIQNFSLSLDIRIILKTIASELLSSNAH